MNHKSIFEWTWCSQWYLLKNSEDSTLKSFENLRWHTIKIKAKAKSKPVNPDIVWHQRKFIQAVVINIPCTNFNSRVCHLKETTHTWPILKYLKSCHVYIFNLFLEVSNNNNSSHLLITKFIHRPTLATSLFSHSLYHCLNYVPNSVIHLPVFAPDRQKCRENELVTEVPLGLIEEWCRWIEKGGA